MSAADGRTFRWVLVGVTGLACLVFLSLFTALPGFGYRSARVTRGDFLAAETRDSDRNRALEALRDPARSARRTLAVRLYFPRADLPYALSPLDATVEDDGAGGVYAAVIDRLTRAPEGSGLLATLPAETKLLTYFRRGDLLLVNLSPAAQSPSPGGLVSSHATLYGLVNSLTSLPGVRRVRLLVSNQEALTLRDGHALDRDLAFFAGAVRPLPAATGTR